MSAAFRQRQLIAAAHHAQSAREAKAFGIGLGEPRVDYAKVHAYVRKVIAAIEPNDSVERFTALGVTVLKGEGRFADKRTLAVGETLIRARRFVIATGSSRPSRPFPAFLISLTSPTRQSSMFSNGRAGCSSSAAEPIGMELAQAFRRLGSEVAVLTAHEALPREDGEAAAIAATALEREGVVIHRHARLRTRGATARL